MRILGRIALGLAAIILLAVVALYAVSQMDHAARS